jgi:hypothetical protein
MLAAVEKHLKASKARGMNEKRYMQLLQTAESTLKRPTATTPSFFRAMSGFLLYMLCWQKNFRTVRFILPRTLKHVVFGFDIMKTSSASLKVI